MKYLFVLIFALTGLTLNAQSQNRFIIDDDVTIKVMLTNNVTDAELKELRALLYDKRGFVLNWSNIIRENGKVKSMTISVDCNDGRFRSTASVDDFNDKKSIGFYRHYSDVMPAPFWIGVEERK
ncbi:MAG: hypothetical protein JNK41_08950 [Saprospiraceae bacterium]|jgi:hypothetical protein|nr:hypothetical protein [Saprospiraceae bacterium]